MSEPSPEKLQELARSIRKHIIRMTHNAGSGHPGGSLGMTDIFTALYFSVMTHDPNNPNWAERDRFILSNGHICPVWYASLAEAGYIQTKELDTLRVLGSRLQGHPSNHDFPFAELATGSLGQGFPAAVGLALAYKMDKRTQHIFVGLGDGEMQEGSIWEALMAAAHYKLGNLIAFVDRNFIQQAGKTEEMMALEPLADKIRAFGWEVIEADGHDFDAIIDAFELGKKDTAKPTFIIFRTTMGKGVSFMENEYKWHGTVPDEEETQKALAELDEGES